MTDESRKKTSVNCVVQRQKSMGNILTLPITFTGLKRGIFLGTENRTGEIIACPVPEYSTA